MWFHKKKRGGDRLASDTIRALNKLKRKRIEQNSAEELNEIIRTFLKEKYNLSQSLTLEEMMKKLKGKRINKQAKLDIAPVLIKIYEKEYKSETPFTKKQLITIIDETKKAIKEMST